MNYFIVISIIVTVFTVGIIIVGFCWGMHNLSKKKYIIEELDKLEKEKVEKLNAKKQKLVESFNKLYIGQTLQDVQILLGSAGDLKEERLLREDKLLYDKDVIKKVYVWKFYIGNVIVVIKCTFYDDKLSAKEQSNLD